jgi:hypothetical protein
VSPSSPAQTWRLTTDVQVSRCSRLTYCIQPLGSEIEYKCQLLQEGSPTTKAPRPAKPYLTESLNNSGRSVYSGSRGSPGGGDDAAQRSPMSSSDLRPTAARTAVPKFFAMAADRSGTDSDSESVTHGAGDYMTRAKSFLSNEDNASLDSPTSPRQSERRPSDTSQRAHMEREDSALSACNAALRDLLNNLHQLRNDDAVSERMGSAGAPRASVSRTQSGDGDASDHSSSYSMAGASTIDFSTLFSGTLMTSSPSSPAVLFGSSPKTNMSGFEAAGSALLHRGRRSSAMNPLRSHGNDRSIADRSIAVSGRGSSPSVSGKRMPSPVSANQPSRRGRTWVTPEASPRGGRDEGDEGGRSTTWGAASGLRGLRAEEGGLHRTVKVSPELAAQHPRGLSCCEDQGLGTPRTRATPMAVTRPLLEPPSDVPKAVTRPLLEPPADASMSSSEVRSRTSSPKLLFSNPRASVDACRSLLDDKPVLSPGTGALSPSPSPSPSHKLSPVSQKAGAASTSPLYGPNKTPSPQAGPSRSTIGRMPNADLITRMSHLDLLGGNESPTPSQASSKRGTGPSTPSSSEESSHLESGGERSNRLDSHKQQPQHAGAHASGLGSSPPQEKGSMFRRRTLSSSRERKDGVDRSWKGGQASGHSDSSGLRESPCNSRHPNFESLSENRRMSIEARTRGSAEYVRSEFDGGGGLTPSEGTTSASRKPFLTSEQKTELVALEVLQDVASSSLSADTSRQLEYLLESLEPFCQTLLSHRARDVVEALGTIIQRKLNLLRDMESVIDWLHATAGVFPGNRARAS